MRLSREVFVLRGWLGGTAWPTIQWHPEFWRQPGNYRSWPHPLHVIGPAGGAGGGAGSGGGAGDHPRAEGSSFNFLHLDYGLA